MADMTLNRLTSLGRAMSDPSRATVLCMLASGTAHTAGELAQHLGRAPSTTSRHLSELIDAGLITMEAAGRHRYFRLASDEVADLLEYIDQLELTEITAPTRPHPSSPLVAARTCYDHLAGELGVAIYRSAVDHELIQRTEHGAQLTGRGHRHLGTLGIDTADLDAGQRPLVRPCLDWTQRTHHLGGSVGAALLEHMLTERWIRRRRDRREVAVTVRGREELQRHFGVVID